jgi:signal transduction histidine kinase
MSDNFSFLSGANKIFIWAIVQDNKPVFSENTSSIIGVEPDEIIKFPLHIHNYLSENDKISFHKKFNNAIEDTGTSSIEFLLHLNVNNEEKWIKEEIVFSRNNAGTVEKITGFCSDVTDLKAEEKENSELLEKLSELNRSKDKFISILSHDLRAPFTSILGFSEILLNEPNLSEAEQKEYLTYINDSSQYQLQLINYLLDWSRLQTGRIKVEPMRLQAQNLVYNCISSLTGNAVRKNIEIRVHVNPLIYIHADEKLISQALTNIISNAIKYSDENKLIEIGAEWFNEHFVEFIIKDQGIGISEENKAKLFKIDKLFSTEGTKGEKGTGLGLSLVKEIIDKHAGEIWFYSDNQKGSEFHFTVPSSQNTILLVETNNDLYETLIKKDFPNFEVLKVKNAFEAIETVAGKTPSLIVTEHEMPLMNGLQLVEYLRREEKNIYIPVIPLVDHLSDEIKNSYNDYGIRTIIEKPVDEKIFYEKLQNVLS